MPTERIAYTSKDAPMVKVLKESKTVQEQMEKLDSMLRTEKGKVELRVNVEGPIRILPISDLHLFAPETDMKKVDAILEKLDEENTYGVICGDFIEGLNTHISDHSGKIYTTFGNQIILAKERLKPYVKKGKILCMVGWFMGHEGWSEKQATIDTLTFLTDGMIQPDGSKLQAVFNGGILEMTFVNSDDKKVSFQLFHDAGGGGSDTINPLGSQRRAIWESSKLNSPDRKSGVIAGHQHHRAATAKELTYDKLTGTVKSEILLALGSPKGNDDKHPDKFLLSMAKGHTKPPGGSIVINQRKINSVGDNIWPTYGYDKGEIVYNAAKIWDATEKRRQTKELLEMIKRREGKPVAEFDRRNSRTRTKEDGTKAPFYETFKWKIKDGKLPVLIYFLANARYGSSSGERDREKLLEVYDQVVHDPFKYVLAMRHYVDNDTAKQLDRREVLREVAEDLKGVHDTNSLLGFMLSSNLRTDSWSKEVKNTRHVWNRHKQKYDAIVDVDDPLWPGDYLYKHSAIAKTPLYGNDSIMLINFGGAEYLFQLLDHLSWSGSEFDMFRGLVQSGRKSRLNLDVVAGGHMPGAGTMVTPDGVSVSTGWYSDYDSRGKGNIRRAPMGGQGVIIFPEKKMVIPASTFFEATDMHKALMLYAGLSKRERDRLENRGR